MRNEDEVGGRRGAKGAVAKHCRQSACLLLAAALAVGSFVPGCSKSKSGGTGPDPTYSLSGQILLIGTRRDETGAPLGDLMLDDADAVRVYLVREGVLADSTLSVDGSFAFQVPLGTYRAFSRIGSFADSTGEIHVHDLPRTFADAIQLSPTGLEPNPSPFTTTLRIPFAVAATGLARLEVVGVSGAPVRTLLDASLVAGAHELHWDGRNALGQQVPPGPYWIVLTAGPTREEALAVRAAVSISGSVEISSRLRDSVGTDIGSRTQVDAEGLRIHLEGPGGLTDSTLTHQGQFRFPVSGSGSHRVWTRLVPGGALFERTVSLGVRDTTLAPLALAASGQIENYPNPFSNPHGVGFEFNLDAPEHYETEVWTFSGSRVWWYADQGVVGLNHIHWNGVDMAQQPVANGSYVMAVRGAGWVRHNVVFKE